ncbi:hypothetical protein E7811_05630 [Aliigemmobacter aestuarii]|uniref:Uncharacterized protein n=1 Tax=Aliigemmobacter aestuarii TaxID=1445661 RepID=A0A4V3V0Z4_9RHOB|nr:hypothetical protein [Gemmobacter aestuarii]THD85872.1 hypothetical protein E7811_05630 [Gemmobacter aestuarii]
MSRHGTARKAAGAVAVAFGLLTVLSGGSTLMGAVDMGAVVPFVLWFNFLAGFAYVAGGILLWRGSRMALPVALGILFATAAVFAAFALHAVAGGAFEWRTVGAMTLRTAFWALMAGIARTGRRDGRTA